MNSSWFHADQTLLPLYTGEQFLQHPQNNVLSSPFSIDYLLGTCPAFDERQPTRCLPTSLPKITDLPCRPYETWIFGSTPITAVPLPYAVVQQPCQAQSNVSRFKEASRRRQVYNKLQVEHLEAAFQSSMYVTAQQRNRLALELNLTEGQVKTWFQNRSVEACNIRRSTRRAGRSVTCRTNKVAAPSSQSAVRPAQGERERSKEGRIMPATIHSSRPSLLLPWAKMSKG